MGMPFAGKKAVGESGEEELSKSDEVNEANLETHVVKPLSKQDIKILDAPEEESPAPKSEDNE